ncbi:MAG: hypothetical protein ACREAX_03450 [Candidatus Nitrosotenuis sp.]
MMEKGRLAALAVLTIFLLGAVPAFGELDTSEILKSVLEQSHDQVEQKIEDLNSQGTTVPDSITTAYDQGSLEYSAALAAIEEGDLEAAQEHALNAMSLFEDGFETIVVSEISEVGQAEDLFGITEDLDDTRSEADNIRTLVAENDFDISFVEYDEAISQAEEDLRDGNLVSANNHLDTANNFLDKIHRTIDEDVGANQEPRIDAFVQNSIKQLDKILENANEIGLSQSVVDSIQNTIDLLEGADDSTSLLTAIDDSKLSELILETEDTPPVEDTTEDASVEDATTEEDEVDNSIDDLGSDVDSIDDFNTDDFGTSSIDEEIGNTGVGDTVNDEVDDVKGKGVDKGVGNSNGNNDNGNNGNGNGNGGGNGNGNNGNGNGNGGGN